MRFLLDENVRAEVGAFLQAAGHDVATTPRGLSDPDVLALAKDQARILVTHDAEFANALRYPPTTHTGIIRLKFHPPALDTIRKNLTALLRQVPAEDFGKALFVLEKGGFRKRT